MCEISVIRLLRLITEKELGRSSSAGTPLEEQSNAFQLRFTLTLISRAPLLLARETSLLDDAPRRRGAYSQAALYEVKFITWERACTEEGTGFSRWEAFF